MWLQREVLNELNGLDQQLAVLDAELSQKEGLATQLHRQLAGVRERLARQGRAPLPGEGKSAACIGPCAQLHLVSILHARLSDWHQHGS